MLQLFKAVWGQIKLKQSSPLAIHSLRKTETARIMNVKPICSNAMTSHSRRNTPWEKAARKVGGSEISERWNSNERKACREHIQIYMVGFLSFFFFLGYICFLTMMFWGPKDPKLYLFKNNNNNFKINLWFTIKCI